MVISIEEFKTYIGHIKAQIAKDDVLTDLLSGEDTSGWISTAPYLIDDMIDIIAKEVAEEAKLDRSVTQDWICWWLWEVDLEKGDNVFWDKLEGVSHKFTIQDEEDLYYMLTGEYAKIKTKVKEEYVKKEEAPKNVQNVRYEDFLNTLKESVEGKK